MNHSAIQQFTPGHSSQDPLLHYQHICDSCKIVKGEPKNPKPNQPSASFTSPEPQAYDPNNHITHFLNVCFQEPDALRCHLTPNNNMNMNNMNMNNMNMNNMNMNNTMNNGRN